jgi:integrase
MVQGRRKSEQVKCKYFTWLLQKRNDVYQADGRGNNPSAGRHSLATRERDKALESLHLLDATVAVGLGLASPTVLKAIDGKYVPLKEGQVEYLSHVARPRSLKGGSKSTQKRYRSVFDKAVAFFEKRGIRTWNEVTQSELESYISDLAKKGYAHATQVMEIVTLKQAINYWIDKDLLPAQQGFKLEVDKVTESTTYCFTTAEVETMIRHCREPEGLSWLGNVIVALAFTGMRIGELVQLRWSAVDLGRKMITVIDDRRSGRSGDNARTTKSGASRRIPIHPRLQVILELLQKDSLGGLVFRAQKGGPLHTRNVLEAFIDDVVEPLKDQFPSDEGEAGFATGRLHSLRHYFCSVCANEGVPERVLMTWLGHSSSAMVKRYYHLNNEEAQLQMRKLGKLASSA